MDSIRTLKLALVLIFCVGVPAAFAHSAGPDPGYTGAPGELTCRQCHNSFPLNDGVGHVTITGVPATYAPGQSYTITVNIDRASRSRWGFQLTALDDSLSASGIFTITDPARTQIKTDSGKVYIEHKTAGTNAGKTGGNSWSVRWTAPQAGSGTVTFYAAANAANNNNSPNGDNIYTAFVESAPTVAVPPFEDATAGSGLGSAHGGNAIAWADFDNDGDQDFLVAGDERAMLYRNDGGAFSEVGLSLGLGPTAGARSAAWGDFDNDGRPDLFVATAAGARLFRNTPSGFTDVTAAASLPAGAAVFGAWVDYDGDGALDLLVGLDGQLALLGGNGSGGFTDVTAAAGLAGVASPRSAAWADYDGDGRADLFVATASSGRLFHQREGAVFDDVSAASGVTGADGALDAVWADYDGDLDLDLFVASGAAVKLYSNDGGTFTDVTASAGLGGAAGSALAVDDSDGDGQLDLLVAEPEGVRLMRYDAPQFVDATVAAGITQVQGAASTWADYDGDGHVDLLVVSRTGLSLWKSPYATPTLTVRALTDADGDTSDADTATDRDAIGAIVALDDNNNFLTGSHQMRVISGGGSTSQPPALAVFSVPNGGTVGVRATFPGGEGRQASAVAGDRTRLALGDRRAASVTSVTYKKKNGVDKLVVDGSGFATNAEVVEVDGTEMGTTKYPQSKRLPDGTSTRISGTDTDFASLVPRGRAVRITTFNPSTGVRSAPVSFTRQ